MKCNQCGKENLELVKSEGSLETFQCRECGHIMYAHVNYGIDEIVKYAERNESSVCVVLGEDVSAKKSLMKLRQHLPELKKHSLIDLEGKIVDGKLDLGRVHKSKIEKLEAVCDEIGVEMLID